MNMLSIAVVDVFDLRVGNDTVAIVMNLHDRWQHAGLRPLG